MKAADDNLSNARRSKLILLNVCVGQFIAGLDQRALLVALPTLTHRFNTSLTTIQWVLLGYDITLIGLVITVGRMGDLFGRRRIYAGGFLVFVFSSVLCGFAQSAGQIIAFRALQALGGAMIVSNGRAVASLAVPANERGKAMGLASMAFHVGFLTGPTLGGFLIDTVGWRWIFFINLPIGIWGAWLAWKLIEESKEEHEKISVDLLGAVLLMLTNSLFIYGMNQLPHVGWHHPTVLRCLFLAVIAFACFVVVELKTRMPILSFSLFRNRLFTASMLSLFFMATSQAAISFLMPFYLQSILHYSASQMGWIIIAGSVVIVLIAPVAGSLSDRFGSRLLCSLGAFGGCRSAILYCVSRFGIIHPADYLSSSADRTGLGLVQFAQSKCDFGFGAERRGGNRLGYEHHRGAHRRRHGRGAFSDSVHLRLARRRLERRANRSAANLGRRADYFYSIVQSYYPYC